MNEQAASGLEKGKGLIGEFKEFINRGNVMDMAVGVIVGSALTAVVTALTDNVINPFITLITGGNGTTVGGLAIPVTDTESIDFGALISAIINFLIVAVVVFAIVKAFNTMRDATEKAAKAKLGVEDKEEEAAPTCPFCLEEINEGATRCPHCTAEIAAA